MRALVTALLLATPYATALAQPESAPIAWGELACGPAAPLEDRVRALLPAERAIPEDLRAEARVTAEEDGFRLVVELSNGTQRELVGGDCEPLLDAAALIVAIAIDPSAITAVPDPEPPDPDPPAPAEPAEPAELGRALGPPPSPPPPSEPSPPRFLLGASLQAAFAVGTLPDALPGPALEVMAAHDAFVVRAGFLYLPASRALFDDRRGASIDLFAGRLALCVRLSLPPVSAELCAEGEAGDLRAAGYGLDHPRSSDNVWASVGPSIRARVALVGPLGISASVGAAFAIDPPTFVIEGLGDVFTPAPVALRALAGVDVELFP